MIYCAPTDWPRPPSFRQFDFAELPQKQNLGMAQSTLPWGQTHALPNKARPNSYARKMPASLCSAVTWSFHTRRICAARTQNELLATCLKKEDDLVTLCVSYLDLGGILAYTFNETKQRQR